MSKLFLLIMYPVLSTWNLMLEDLERIDQFGVVWNIDNIERKEDRDQLEYRTQYPETFDFFFFFLPRTVKTGPELV